MTIQAEQPMRLQPEAGPVDPQTAAQLRVEALYAAMRAAENIRSIRARGEGAEPLSSALDIYMIGAPALNAQIATGQAPRTV